MRSVHQARSAAGECISGMGPYDRAADGLPLHRRAANGERSLPTAPKNAPIRFPPLKQLIIYWLPWPKGVPTAPELLARPPSEWQGELVTLRDELAALVKRGRSGPFVPHPAFGRLTPRAWGVLVYRHLDHHLRQFGV